MRCAGTSSWSAANVDMKMFEPAMRHLLDTHIRAEERKKRLSAINDMTLVELIVERGEEAAEALGMSRQRLLSWCQEHDVQTFKYRKRWMVHQQELLNALQRT